MTIVEYVPIIWFILAGLVPVALVIIGTLKILKKDKFGELFIKLFIVFLLYFPVTIFGFVYIAALINAIADAKGIIINGVRGDLSLDLTSFTIVFGYFIFGVFLCWFVSKDLSKILSFITGSNRKSQSIFEKR
ncbi:MAG TPA: hypothetical protein VF556_01325 [Pyrinomonadaceae bacterium]|jgi:asparagine N-glycosylation enzyme membrane subunit Stt3